MDIALYLTKPMQNVPHIISEFLLKGIYLFLKVASLRVLLLQILCLSNRDPFGLFVCEIIPNVSLQPAQLVKPFILQVHNVIDIMPRLMVFF